jgi:hypothetical protein
MKQSARFEVASPRETVGPALVAGLPTLGIRVDHLDPASGRIWADTAATMKSDGTLFEFVVSALGPDATRVDVTAQTRSRTVLTDWGRTKADLANIGRLVETGRGLDPPVPYGLDPYRPTAFTVAGVIVGAVGHGLSSWSFLWAAGGGLLAFIGYTALWKRNKKRLAKPPPEPWPAVHLR